MSLPQSLSRSLILDAPGNLFPNPQVNVSTSSSSFFIQMQRDELEEQDQTSCLVYLEERDKCRFRLFQGTHINHASEEALGVGMVGGLGREGVCLPEAHSFQSLRKLWKCPLHTLGSSAELQRYVSGDKMPACCSIVESETCMLSKGVGLTSLQRVNLYPTVTPDPDPVTKVWRRNHTQVYGGKHPISTLTLTWKMTKLQFMQQKKLFIWDTHCQYKLRDHKTYTFRLFFSTENRFWIGIKKTIVFHLIPFYIRRDLKS